MKILLTNDDGFHADGIQELYKSLSERHEVFLVAPEKNCSGFSASISYTTQVEIDQVSETEFIVKGTPADCVYFGLFSLMDKDIDIVISGINHGANIGNDVIYSGTVGAAVGGRKLKYPPIAISVASYSTLNINFIVNKSSELIDKIIKLPAIFDGKVFNINFPDLNEKKCKGIKVTGVAKRDIPAKPIEVESENDNKRYRYNLSGKPIKESITTDADALQDGFISVSILDYGLDNPNLREKLTDFIYE